MEIDSSQCRCCGGQTGHVRKRKWTIEEDLRLVAFMETHCPTPSQWRQVPKAAGIQRCSKSCRIRWTRYLRPDVKAKCFTEEEDMEIIRLFKKHAGCWTSMAKELPGRTPRIIRKRCLTHKMKKLLRDLAAAASEEENRLQTQDIPFGERCPDLNLNLELTLRPPVYTDVGLSATASMERGATDDSLQDCSLDLGR